jgi:hypothetical protein
MMLYYYAGSICFFAENLEAVLDRSKGLLARLRGRGTEDQLGVQLPGSRDVPGLGDLLINQRAVVLQVGTETLGLKGNPN